MHPNVSHPKSQPQPSGHKELWLRACALSGHTVGALAQALGVVLADDPRRRKGFVGRLAEMALGADPLALERPDFPHLGVELKTVPVSPSGRPCQSTFVCSINLGHAADDHWAQSRLRLRLGTVLFVPYLPAEDGAGAQFLPPLWWQPTAEEWAALEGDWEDLMGTIGAGRGDILTARIGRVLQVRPKAANARVRTLGPAEDGLQAMLPLGFYLRAGFVGGILAAERNRLGPP